MAAVYKESEENEDIDNDVKLKKLLNSNKVDVEKNDIENVKSVSNEKQKRTTVCKNNSLDQQKDYEKNECKKKLSYNTIALKINFKVLNDYITNEHKEFVNETFKMIA